MSTLREQIKDKHDVAEKCKFTEFLLLGKINKRMYAEYLYNQYLCYRVLEEKAKELGYSNDRLQVGVSAQEVEKVLPEVVTDSDGIKHVSYDQIIGLLVEAVKQLKQEVDELKKVK